MTQPDRPAGRGRKLTANVVKAAALERGLRILQPQRIRQAEIMDQIFAMRPDVIVVASFGQILPQTLLDLPSGGCLNLHPSLLPRYRGPSPIVGAVLKGETATGTTLMLMAARMDAGPVLRREELTILPNETAGELETRLAALSADVLLQHISPWLLGAIDPMPQDEALATYTRRLTKEDGRIEWSRPADRLAREVRAYNPWPVAFTFWQGRQLRILRAVPAPGVGDPGQIIGAEDGRLKVGTGEGVLELIEVQLAGGRVMQASELAAGHRDLMGSYLISAA